jgi:Exo-beta-D-glucosaminidase Ig-fold domain
VFRALQAGDFLPLTWHDLDPKQYFTGVGAAWGDGGIPYGMRSEIGMATFTNFNSFKKFMPQETWWPRNEMWNKHFFGSSDPNAGTDGYFADVNRRYGRARGIEEFCRNAQLLNLETMKALFEGWLDHSDKDSAGVIIWMSQSAYPSLVWQTYDYYYDLNGAYWGAKSACEPVHIYWNENDDRIRVVNTSGKNVDGLTAEALIYNLDGSQKFERKSDPFTSTFDAVADCFTLTYPADLSPTHFIRLRLTDSSGKLVSENFYWRSAKYLNFKALGSLKKVDLGVSSQMSQANGEDLVTATVTNPADSQTVAFAIRPMLVKPSTGDQILPVYTSDGYFSLMPGESKQISFHFAPALAGNEPPKVQLECYNNFLTEQTPITEFCITA